MVGTVPDKEASELWAFSAAILPWINNCDADVASRVRANTDITSDTAPMSDGYASVKADLESVYGCIGITCGLVGGYLDESGEYLEGFEPCSDSDLGISTAGDSGDSSDSGLSGGGIAGVTIAVGAVAIAAVAGVVLMKKRNARNKAATVNEDLGNF